MKNMGVEVEPGKFLPVWANGVKGWTWSDDCGCYMNQEFDQPPTKYCLGERMIHVSYGKDSYGIIWMGSTCDNWHGFYFGYDLGKAIRWVRGAEYVSANAQLWTNYN